MVLSSSCSIDGLDVTTIQSCSISSVTNSKSLASKLDSIQRSMRSFSSASKWFLQSPAFPAADRIVEFNENSARLVNESWGSSQISSSGLPKAPKKISSNFNFPKFCRSKYHLYFSSTTTSVQKSRFGFSSFSMNLLTFFKGNNKNKEIT